MVLAARAAEVSIERRPPLVAAPEHYPYSPLNLVVDEARSTGAKLQDLTVLAEQRDPFRLDTAANHRDAQWFASVVEDANLGDRTIHLRGLHYAAFTLRKMKPNGLPYRNTEEDWLYLQEKAAKAARWLGYVPFDRIFDNRNSAPVVRLHKEAPVAPYLNVGAELAIPSVEDLVPTVGVDGFVGVQPYRLVLIGEKSSLEEVLAPVARDRQADLYLPAGEISDTLLWRVAADTRTDGRPLVVLYFSDCDPGGWQMPISVGRKLQALQAGWFSDIDFDVYRVALVPDQVREYGLPSAPMKETERRKDRWLAAMGVEQTEIDSIATLRPDLLRQIAIDAIAPFWDSTLARRVVEARNAWIGEAQAIVDASTDTDMMATVRADAARELEAMADQVAAINEALRVDVESFALPEPVVPVHALDLEAHGLPLVSSSWSWAEQTRALIASKAYRDGRE
jgi:hypothetical protein